MEQLFEKKEMKFLLLKAILLGIQYGKSEKSEDYKNGVVKEIQKLSEQNKIQQQPKRNQDYIDAKKMNDNYSNNKSNYSNNYNHSNISNPNQNNNSNQKKEEPVYKSALVERLEGQLVFLENERMKTYYTIQYLSNSNYTYNYARIQYLYNQYATIQEEIDKKRFSIEKEKKNDIVRQNDKKYRATIQQQQPQQTFYQITQLRHEEHKKQFSEDKETFIQNAKQVIEEKQEQSDDQTLKTLEKTLQSLSSIFMSD